MLEKVTMNGKALALAIAAAALWLALIYWSGFTTSGHIDSCLDAGGGWDYEHGKCEGARSTP